MFDIGFSEILLVAVVALVVIGPERLPGVARNVGRIIGRLQRYVHDIKSDFNREVELEEIRRIQHEMENTVQSMQESMRAVESSLQQEVRAHQTTLAEPPLPLEVAAKPQSKKAIAKDSEAQPAPKEDQLSLF